MQLRTAEVIWNGQCLVSRNRRQRRHHRRERTIASVELISVRWPECRNVRDAEIMELYRVFADIKSIALTGTADVRSVI